MSTKQETVDNILSKLDGLDVRVRKMFGEYGLYCDEKVTAFVCDDTLFVKILPGNDDLAEGLLIGPAYPGSKDYYVISKSKINDEEWLRDFIQVTADIVPAKKNK